MLAVGVDTWLVFVAGPRISVMESTVFWDVTPCNPLNANRRFGSMPNTSWDLSPIMNTAKLEGFSNRIRHLDVSITHIVPVADSGLCIYVCALELLFNTNRVCVCVCVCVLLIV
jgi:hypothetical protein